MAMFSGVLLSRCLCLIYGQELVLLPITYQHPIVAGISAAIEAVGARLIYLSPYSPDFNQE